MSAQALLQTARQLLRQGLIPEATDLLQQALHIDPDLASAHVALGNLAQQQHRLEQAAFHYRELTRLRPEQAEPWCRLGLLLLQTSHRREAAAALEQALKRDPEDAALRASLGLLWHELDERDHARQYYQQALVALPERVDLHYHLARLLEPPEALLHLEQALARQPDWDAACLLKASLLGDTDAALAEYQALVDRQPEHLIARYQYACLLHRRHQLSAAEQQLNELIQREYFSPRAWFEKALIAREQRDLAKLQFCLGEAFKMDPNQPELHQELAWLYEQQGDTLKALRHHDFAEWMLRDRAELAAELAAEATKVKL